MSETKQIGCTIEQVVDLAKHFLLVIRFAGDWRAGRGLSGVSVRVAVSAAF